MAQTNQALKVALAAAEQLPLKLQKELATKLLATTTPHEEMLIVQLRRLSAEKQSRLTVLMDKHTEGQLSRAELSELKRLNHEVNKLMMLNTEALTRAMHPEFFNKKGQLVKRQVQAALQDEARSKARKSRK